MLEVTTLQMYKSAVSGIRADRSRSEMSLWMRVKSLYTSLKTSSERHGIFMLHDPRECCFVFGTERYLKMKHISNSQSSQPTAFMNHLMTLSNQTQVQTIYHNTFRIRHLCHCTESIMKCRALQFAVPLNVKD